MEKDVNTNQEHLKLLSVFHYVVGALVAIFSSVFIMHLVLGIVFIVAPQNFADKGDLPPSFFGWIFAVMGGVAVFSGWIFAICLIYAGRFLSRRKHYLFCLVIAALSCLFVPFGTILGVFTIVILSRPQVKEIFAFRHKEK
ncbi:MAG: hypothetical protein JSV34_02320 [Candidatus Omnitrophota bacterium]|nr:MAG: hypothetical protein JSV34_02320 [Candidatus Omnitrophota bacterium]